MTDALSFITSGRSGVYQLDSPIDGTAVFQATQKKDYYFAHINGATAQTSRDLLPAISAALRFPDYFGNNWDALADMLGDFSSLASDGYTGQVIVFSHIEHLREQDPTGYDSLMGVLNHTVKFRQDFEDATPFIVLIAS